MEPVLLWDARNQTHGSEFFDVFNWKANNRVQVLHAATQQGPFNVCWAHAAALSISAGRRALNVDHQIVQLSPQYLINGCVRNHPKACAGTQGYGYWAQSAIEWVRMGGICREITLPYTGIVGMNDQYHQAEAALRTTEGCGLIDWEMDVIHQLHIQPIVATMYVDEVFSRLNKDSNFVYNGPKEYWLRQPENNLGAHSVVIIGYGFEKRNDAPYWIIQNSWGSEWGIEGCARVRRNAGLVFGFSYPIISIS